MGGRLGVGRLTVEGTERLYDDGVGRHICCTCTIGHGVGGVLAQLRWMVIYEAASYYIN